jgi:hypothetical protein
MVLKKNSERKVEYNRRYMADLRAQRRVNGLCTVCGAPARVGKTECHNCFTMHMEKRDQRKRRAVEYLGGRCADCGYQTDFVTVYDFHHKDKSEKTVEISYLITANVGWKKLQRELDKCILLCANCHRIRHALEDEDIP